MGEATTVVSARRQSDTKRLGLPLRGELDWIVMKVLEKDRTRRHEIAAACDDGFCVHVWNLQAIRRQLGQMKLDWQDQKTRPVSFAAKQKAHRPRLPRRSEHAPKAWLFSLYHLRRPPAQVVSDRLPPFRTGETSCSAIFGPNG
jgi:hypothetical protein